METRIRNLGSATTLAEFRHKARCAESDFFDVEGLVSFSRGPWTCDCGFASVSEKKVFEHVCSPSAANPKPIFTRKPS